MDREPCVVLEYRCRMVVAVCVYTANDREIICTASDFLEKITDFKTALTIFAKRKWRLNEITGSFYLVGLYVFPAIHRSMEAFQFGFRIKGIDLAGPPLHHETDYGFGTGLEMRGREVCPVFWRG